MKKKYLLICMALFLFSCSNENELIKSTENTGTITETGTNSSGELNTSSGENTDDQLSKELSDDLNEVLNLVPNE